MSNIYIVNIYLLFLFFSYGHSQFNTIKSQSLPDISKDVVLDTLRFSVNNYNSDIIQLPLDVLSISSPFGQRIDPINGKPSFHSGVDLRGKFVPVYAVMDATIKKLDYSNRAGIHMSLSFGYNDYLEVGYSHMSKVFHRVGDKVIKGTIIGYTGDTGRANAAHLHFSVKKNGSFIDPMTFLNLY